MPANNRRKLVSLEVADAEKRRLPSKHYSYAIKVVWTDESETVIYRRYSKFFDFQIILLETFPYEGGLKEPSARIIPFLPGKILFRRSHVRDVAMKRLKPIDEYCKALVRLPAHISESEHVLDFFETKPEDLNPVREDGSRRKRRDEAPQLQPSRVVRRTRSLDIGEISGPLLLEQYVAIAEYTSTQNKELTLANGQQVEVIEKNENGWWFVSSDEGERGWVPGVYLEKPDGSIEDLITNQAEPGHGEHYIAIHPHTAENSDEVSFNIGVVVEVLQKNLEGWWLIKYNGKQGYAPASYLEKAHDWVQENNKRPVQIISSVHDLKHRNSLPSNSLSSIAYPSQKILRSSSSFKTAADVHQSPSNTKPEVPLSPKPKTVQPPPKRSSVKRIKKRPDGPPPLPPSIESEPVYEYMTVAPFNADIPDGVSFNEEKKVAVLEKSPGGWWYIQIDGSEGWAPASYIEKREKPQKLKVHPPLRPGPPKLMKNNSTGNIGVNGKVPLPAKVPDKSSISHPLPLRNFSTMRSQSVMSPAKRPLPPLPTSTSESSLQKTEKEVYEEVGANARRIEEELPIFRTPPLPPSAEKKYSPEHVPKPKFPEPPVAKGNENGQLDFRSVLKSSIVAKHNEIKNRPTNSPPRPPTKPGSNKSDVSNSKPLLNGFHNKSNLSKVPEKSPFPPKSTSAEASENPKPIFSVKKPERPPKFQAQEGPPRLPPKPKPSLKANPVLRNVQSSDDGAIVDFRSVLRSTQRKQSDESNGVGRSKSFNADKIISTQIKNQNKPPSVPKKPANMPLKPPVPSKMKGIDSAPEIAESTPKPSSVRKANGKPTWGGGNKPVLRRFQSNNSNSNVDTEKEKPCFTVGHMSIELTHTTDISAAFTKRGSPDGQVEEKFEDRMGKYVHSKPVFPPERLKKLEKESQNLDFKAVVSGKSDEQQEDSIVYAVSDYNGVEDCEISFTAGDKAEVIEKAENNWWYVSIDGKLGWAPSSFFRCEKAAEIQKTEMPTVPDKSKAAKSNEIDSVYSEIREGEEHCFPAQFKAAADFEAAEPSMLSLTADEEVTVTQEAEGGWWLAISADGSREGWVPSSYLYPI